MASRRIRLAAAGMVAIALLAVSASGTFARSVERPFVLHPSGYARGIVYSPSFPDGDAFGGRCSRPPQWVITSANGDQIHATYEGVMTGETTFADSVTIRGGTGRFAGATGSLAETGWYDPATGYMELSGVGTISYDASERASG